ncbi:MAG: hypothetical protein NVSMB65_19290 [Chloroflexota bacterium]
MPSPSSAILAILATFAPAFTAPTFAHAQVLVYGTLLAVGRRTVTAALRAVGLVDERHFTTYHRVLNRAVWSPLVLSRLLLGLLVVTLLVPGAPLLVVIDETLERRWGKKIAYKGRFRDAVRSRGPHIVTSPGVQWLCVLLLVPVPWSRRPWACPFLTVPALAPATSAKLGKRHRTAVDRAGLLIRLVRRWQPDREIVLVGDSGFAAVSLGHTCRRQTVALVSRLRLDAALYDPPAPQPSAKRGPKPKKGPRQPSLATRLVDAAMAWQTATVPWYGGVDEEVEWTTGTALWHRSGEAPLPLRWVLARDPQRCWRPLALLCTDPNVSAEQILRLYLLRWNVEVTFEELRAHLGLETQRQWSTPAIARTTPCLAGLFSLVVLLAHALHPHHLPTRRAAWYPKTEATFADALAAVRRHLLASHNCTTSVPAGDETRLSPQLWSALADALCYAA